MNFLRRAAQLLALSLLSILPACAQNTQPAMKPNAPTFTNPLKTEGADPCLFFHEGWYYLSTTTAVDVRLRRARRLNDLKTAADVQVWKDDTPTRFRDMWAAEFHLLDSGNGPRWYLYYTAADGKADNNHRMYVCESAGTDPLGPYTFKAQLRTDPEDKHYAIDGNILKLANGDLYMVWCGRPSPTGQGLYIQRMTNPWTLTGARTYLNADGFGCDVVREGPEVLQRNGRIFLTYSMCGASTPDYRLSMLVADEGADLLKPESWKQYPKLLMARVDQNGVYGPGHHFFFKSPDGTQDWIAYHAKSSTKDTYADRSTRAQMFTWNEDGTPKLPIPVALGEPVVAPSGEPAPDKK